MKGLENNNDDIAINIKLKKEKINFGLWCKCWFSKWQGIYFNPKVFYYSPKPV
jgi:hypothetical protein